MPLNKTQYIIEIILLREPCDRKNLNIIIPPIEPNSPPDKINKPILISSWSLNQWASVPETDAAKILFAPFATA